MKRSLGKAFIVFLLVVDVIALTAWTFGALGKSAIELASQVATKVKIAASAERVFESTIEPQIVYKAVVVRVIDGDTIVLANDERIRYIGMDTPEQGRPYYQETKAKNEELVKGKVVGLELDVQERDEYGRLLAYVWLDSGVMINAELLRTGYAQILTIPPNVRYQDQFLELQRQAREDELGLWGLEEIPQPPEAEPEEETPAVPTQEVTPEQPQEQPPAEEPTQEEPTQEQPTQVSILSQGCQGGFLTISKDCDI